MSVFSPPYKTLGIFSVAYLLVRSWYLTGSTEHYLKHLEQEKRESKAKTPAQGLTQHVSSQQQNQQLVCL